MWRRSVIARGRRRNVVLWIAVVELCLAVGVGCGPTNPQESPDSLLINTHQEAGVQPDGTHLIVPGMEVAFEVAGLEHPLYAGETSSSPAEEVSVESSNPEVISVRPGDEPAHYVARAESTGEATIVARMNGVSDRESFEVRKVDHRAIEVRGDPFLESSGGGPAGDYMAFFGTSMVLSYIQSDAEGRRLPLDVDAQFEVSGPGSIADQSPETRWRPPRVTVEVGDEPGTVIVEGPKETRRRIETVGREALDRLEIYAMETVEESEEGVRAQDGTTVDGLAGGEFDVQLLPTRADGRYIQGVPSDAEKPEWRLVRGPEDKIVFNPAKSDIPPVVPVLAVGTEKMEATVEWTWLGKSAEVTLVFPEG